MRWQREMERGEVLKGANGGYGPNLASASESVEPFLAPDWNGNRFESQHFEVDIWNETSRAIGRC